MATSTFIQKDIVKVESEKEASPKDQHPKPMNHSLNIEFPPLSDADNASLISQITNIVNLVFVEAEAGIWEQGFQRTTEAEVADFIRKGQLAVSYLRPSLSFDDHSSTLPGQPVGCVCVRRHSDTLCTFSMLSIDKAHQGTGLGRELVKFAESHCLAIGCSTMGLDLLVPTSYAHPTKTRMQAWYTRLGYRVIKLGSFADEYPTLEPLLAGPVEYRIFEKKLR